MNKSADIYQFVILGAIVAMNLYCLYISSAPNDLLTGALVGVMIGLPNKNNSKGE
jgi:hypothetical protein